MSYGLDAPQRCLFEMRLNGARIKIKNLLRDFCLINGVHKNASATTRALRRERQAGRLRLATAPLLSAGAP
jgi:hypothetical protein